MIEINYRGRFGNTLIQYAIAKIIQDIKRCPIVTKLPEKYDIFPQLGSTRNYIPKTYKFKHSELYLNDAFVDYNLIRKHWGRIKINHYHQKAENFRDYHLKLKDWFQTKSYWHKDLPPPSKTLLIHYRKGDYQSLAYSEQQIEDCIKKIKFPHSVVVITEFPEELSQSFRDKYLTFTTGNLLEDFRLLQHSQYLMITESTFSWCAGMFGHQQHVFIPNIRKLWIDDSEINLHQCLLYDNRFLII